MDRAWRFLIIINSLCLLGFTSCCKLINQLYSKPPPIAMGYKSQRSLRKTHAQGNPQLLDIIITNQQNRLLTDCGSRITYSTVIPQLLLTRHHTTICRTRSVSVWSYHYTTRNSNILRTHHVKIRTERARRMLC